MSHPRRRWIPLACSIALAAMLSATSLVHSADSAASTLTFEKDIYPIFQSRCFRCHGEQKRQAGLDLRSIATVLGGSQSGPVVVPHKPDESVLLELVGLGEMPADGENLTAAQVETIRKWIAAGATFSESAGVATPLSQAERTITDGDRQFWSFQPPLLPDVPEVSDAGWVAGEIDAFVLAKLEKNGLSPAPTADKATLLRRVTFDLTGLPPTPEELADYLDDDSPQAWEKVVDRLLASPRYGERWAQHWLDLARYSDTEGFAYDRTRPAAWRYRDWVISAFKDDMPYDEFVRRQIAGDELYPADTNAFIATGFHLLGPEAADTVDLELRNQDRLNDVTDTVGAAFLGLTLGCARCHDHKFDPLTQRDYYQMQAFFAPSQANHAYLLETDVKRVKEFEEFRAAHQKTLREKLEGIDALDEKYRRKLIEAKRQELTEEERAAYGAPSDQRTPEHQALAERAADKLHVTELEVAQAYSSDDRDARYRLFQFVRDESGPYFRPRQFQVAMGLSESSGAVPKTHLLYRGNHRAKGPEVGPNFPAVLVDATLASRDTVVPAPAADAETTGRRSVLACWLTEPDHPLTARVMVNRIWQHHFGRGIVRTASDFGLQGERPTHPELLDWLTVRFVGDGWSIRKLHRLILTSSTYRQSTRYDPEAARVDPENRLLWRINRRRLDGEELRDAALLISGRLNLKMGGPGVRPPLPESLTENVFAKGEKGWLANSDSAEWTRRSIYVFRRRNFPYPLFAAFDGPDSNLSCPQRPESVVAPQALHLLNDPEFVDCARALAGRLLADAPDDADRRIRRLYMLALSREPTGDETALARAFLKTQADELAQRQGDALKVLALPTPLPVDRTPAQAAAMTDLCLAVMNLNEFVYVD